jgi:hypothetical protein
LSRWFRLDDDIINDPKILLLPEAMRWIWIAFLCISSKNGGVLPAIEIVALSLRVKPSKATEYLSRLVIAGLVDNTFYTCDFAVLRADMSFELHEVKGYWEQDSRVKIKVAASLYPFRFIAVTPRAKKNGGGYDVEEF